VQNGLRGYVDGPTPHQVLDGATIAVFGWHADGDAPVAAVSAAVAAVDDQVLGWTTLTTGLRPDVAATTGDPRLAGTGWHLEVPMPPHRGPASLVVTVWPHGSPPTRLPPVPVLLADPPAPPPPPEPSGPVGWLDLPPTLAREVVTVSGWSFDPRGPLSRVEIALDPGPTAAARLGLPRPDVADLHPQPHAGLAGFEDLLDLSAVPADLDTLTLSADGWDAHGMRTRIATAVVALQAPIPETAEAGRAAPHWATTRAPAAGVGLRLVVFTHHLGYGGGQLWLQTLLEHAGAGRAFPCTVLSATDGPLRAQLEALGIAVHVSGALPLEDAAAYRGRVYELAAVVGAIGATAVLANTAGSFTAVEVAALRGIPVVWAIHESFTPAAFLAAAYPPGLLAPAVRTAFLEALGRADAMVFEAELTRQQYVPAARTERTHVVRYGIDAYAISTYCADMTVAAARAAVGLPIVGRCVLVVGTVEPRKAQTVIAQAFAALAGEHPDVTLVFVGQQPGPYGQGLADYVAAGGLAKRVVLAPVAADIYPWYRAADLLLTASDVESLPRSVLEAMAFAVPVLATAVFGLTELIKDGSTGYLVAPRDLAALTDGLARVLSAPAAQLRAVGTAGREHVLAHHDADGYAREILGMLERLQQEYADAQAAPGKSADGEQPTAQCGAQLVGEGRADLG
jgi:D-inositol-3-phosphate glycosyltransferase